MLQHREIWKKFCLAQRIAETGVPLFDASAEGTVSTVSIGLARPRQVLRRSAEVVPAWQDSHVAALKPDRARRVLSNERMEPTGLSRSASRERQRAGGSCAR